MNKSQLILLILLLSTGHKVFSQSDFRDGFVLTLTGDTIRGKIEYRSNIKNYESCIFKDESTIVKYSPLEINGFGYTNDKLFSSQIAEGSFVEVLISGELSLYKAPQKFYIQNNTELHALESKETKTIVNGMEAVKNDNAWKGLIFYLISDCIENPNETKVSFNEKSLTEVVIKYNKCKGSEYTEFKINTPWSRIRFGASVGLVRSVINSKTTSSSLSHLASSYNSVDPSAGVLFEISSPRISDRISLQVEVHFVKSSYTSSKMLNSFNPIYHDVYIDLSTISFPLSLKYYLLQKKFGLYLQAGFNADYHAKGETKLLSEQVYGSTVITLPEQPAFDNLNKSQIGLLGGLGISRSFNHFEGSIGLRYFIMPNLNKGEFPSNMNRFTINLILFKK